jgi:hypothetical protein
MNPSLTGSVSGTRRAARAPTWLAVLVPCLTLVVLAVLSLSRSTFNDVPGHVVVVEKARTFGLDAVRSARAATQQIVTPSHVMTAEARAPEAKKSITGARIVASGAAVILFLYLVYVLVDGATRGRFRGFAFTLAAMAFVVTCVAVARLS